MTSLAGAWGLVRFGSVFSLNDVATNRSSHSGAIPKGAGLGILASFLLSSVVLSFPAWLWMPALLISVASFLGGDKRLFSVRQRLALQFCCGTAFLVFLFYTRNASPLEYVWCIPLSLFVAGTANFYNFMDGIDGIAGVTAVVGFGLLCGYAGIGSLDPPYGILCLILVFSCLGFLCLNFPYAKVFLGDVGSILLGFLFACMVLALSGNVTEFFVMAGFLAPFYFDELFTMAVRIKDKDSLSLPHRKHVYQLLANEIGIRHWKISLSYGAFQFVVGMTGLFLQPEGIWYVLSAYAGYGIVFLVFSIFIRRAVSVR